MGDTGVSFRSMNSTQIMAVATFPAPIDLVVTGHQQRTLDYSLPCTPLSWLVLYTSGSAQVLHSPHSLPICSLHRPPHSMLLHRFPGSTLGRNPPPRLCQAHTRWIRRFLLHARETSYACPSSNHHTPPSAPPEADNTGSTSPRTVYGEITRIDW